MEVFPDPHEWQFVPDNGTEPARSKCSLVGQFRASPPEIRSSLERLSTQRFSAEALNWLFCNLSGEYAVKWEDNDFVFIVGSYVYPEFYVVQGASNDHIIVTNDEKRSLARGFSPESAALRLLSTQAYYLPEGLGHPLEVVPPGMGVRINKRTFEVTLNWILPVESIATRDDHDALSREIADAIVDEMGSFKQSSLSEPPTLQLSSGLDSALLLAAAHTAKLDVVPVNFRSPGQLDESAGAYRVAKYFGRDLLEILKGPAESDTQDIARVDIGNYLRYAAPLLKTSSAQFVVNNISLLVGYRLGYHTTIEGSSYPTILCLKHYTQYPKGRRQVFDPSLNSDLRYKLSYNFAERELGLNPVMDFWAIADCFPQIHPYYWRFLQGCFNGSVLDSVFEKAMFPSLSAEMLPDGYIYRAMRARGITMIRKLLDSTHLRANIGTPDAQVAVAIQKLVQHLNGPGFGVTKIAAYRRAGLTNQVRPGLAPRVASKLLSANIDDRLIGYPKWHLFQAFELLAGRDFWKIRAPRLSTGSLKEAKALVKRQRKYNVKRELIRNAFLLEWVKENNIEERYRDIVDNIPAEGRNSLEKSREYAAQSSSAAHFWLQNMKINLSLLQSPSS